MTSAISGTDDNGDLVALSLHGDRDAFRQIVERYQNLVCALAYSACGNVAKSEDLTQETFLVAWQRLRELEEPSNLKAWLCGIVRNLARNAGRKRSSSEVNALPICEAIESADKAISPQDIAAAREEAAIVERALDAIPETYREPLVLFYREDQSVQNVADAMGLSTEAVRQRLARGRNMLRAQVEAIVARSLRNTKPTAALTIAIMTALPGITSQAQAAILAGAAAKAAPAVAKPFLSLSLLSAVASPIISLFVAAFMGRLAVRHGNTPREKQFLKRFAWQIGIVVFASAITISMVSISDTFLLRHPIWFATILAASILLQLAAVIFLSLRADKRLKQIRLDDNK